MFDVAASRWAGRGRELQGCAQLLPRRHPRRSAGGEGALCVSTLHPHPVQQLHWWAVFEGGQRPGRVGKVLGGEVGQQAHGMAHQALRRGGARRGWLGHNGAQTSVVPSMLLLHRLCPRPQGSGSSQGGGGGGAPTCRKAVSGHSSRVA
jgi:hypothetical protein